MPSLKLNHYLSRAGSGLRYSLLIGCSLGWLGWSQSVSAQGQEPAVAVSAPAATQNAVVIKLTQQKVVTDKGTERMVDASAVIPGDVIEYQATYTNTSAKPVNGLQGNLPIPEGLDYVERSAHPGAASVKAATKDGVYGVEPLQHRVAGKLVPVPYADYRALRWNLGKLAPGASVVVSARAQVETAPPVSSVQP